jgi:hypothetical protein
MMHGGGPEHEKRMDQLRGEYKFGIWAQGRGRYTGKDVVQHPDMSISLDRRFYVKETC